MTAEDRLPLARFLTVATLLRAETRWGFDWPSIAANGLLPGHEAEEAEKTGEAPLGD